MEVIDDERFYDAFDWEPAEGGFAPLKKVAEDTSNHVAAVTGAHKINVLVACGQTVRRFLRSRLSIISIPEHIPKETDTCTRTDLCLTPLYSRMVVTAKWTASM